MEQSAPRAALVAWTELRLDLQPTANGAIVQTRLPDKSTFSRQSKGSRRVLTSYPACKSQEEYRRRHFARSGGIFFRSGVKFPHSILWRCLEDNNTLELRSVDLRTPESTEKPRDAPVILHFILPAAIRNGCVGFADSAHGDSLDVFVLTESKELYTLSIRSSWFMASEKSDEDPERWCRNIRPSTLALGQVLKLASTTSTELLFAMTDGRTVKLQRQPGADGTSWSEISYSEGQWSGLRGLIPWQNANKIKYEGYSIDHGSALEVLPSPDGKHLISVTVSHTLKIWSLESGKPVYERDILGIQQDASETSKMTLDPSLKHVLAIDPIVTPGPVATADQYYIFTYSPHQGGNFKVWAVRDPDLAESGGVQDMFLDQALLVPDPDDNAVWTLADFKLAVDQSTHVVSLWIMLRLNRRYKLFHKKFDNIFSLAEQWMDDWQQTHVADPTVPFETAKYTIPASEPLGLALNLSNGLPWFIHTDSVAPIRAVSAVEELVYNPPAVFLKSPGSIIQSTETPAPPRFDVATLIDAAAQFRAGLSGLPLEDAVRTELWQDTSCATAQRMQIFFDQANFDRISERVIDDLERSLVSIGGFEGLKEATFCDVLSGLPIGIAENDRFVTDAKTSFGRKALVTGAQEASFVIERVISDLLYLLVYVDQALDPEEFSITDLPTENVFEALVKRLRSANLARWMATHSRSGSDSQSAIIDYRAKSIAIQSDGNLRLHDSIYNLWVDCTGDTEDIESPATAVFSDLLGHGELDLANSFLRYLSSNPLPTYLRGRHALLSQEYATAAIYFKKAAFGMSTHSDRNIDVVKRTASFVSSAEEDSFGHGLTAYYTHIEGLFSVPSIQAYVQSSSFASLALQSFDTQPPSKRHSSLRSDLLARLFHATVHLGDYDAAFAALSRYTDKALRRASVKELVVSMIGADAIQELLELPFSEAVKKEVDTLLAERARKDSIEEAEVADAVKVLYAWRIKHGDYRGAAACLVERLQAQRSAGRKRPKVRATGTKDGVLNDYLISINALSLLGQSEGVEDAENEGWLFVEKGDATGPRSLVRLKDLRRDYQDEMDQREKWAKGRFALTAADDEEDEDGDAIMAT